MTPWVCEHWNGPTRPNSPDEKGFEWIPVYASPPSPVEVAQEGLSDEQIMEFAAQCDVDTQCSRNGLLCFARDIESATAGLSDADRYRYMRRLWLECRFLRDLPIEAHTQDASTFDAAIDAARAKVKL